jgi:hypothetical protein
MKRYTVEVIIEEGCDEFWDDFAKRKITGCDELLSWLRSELSEISDNIRIKKFEDTDR